MGANNEDFALFRSTEQPKTYGDVMRISQGAEMQTFIKKNVNANGKDVSNAQNISNADLRTQSKFVGDDEGTVALNRQLRSGGNPNTEDFDRWTTSQKIANPIKVYRGVILPKEVHETLTPGSTFRDPGYLSTSPYSAQANVYLKARRDDGAQGDDVIFHHLLPAGHPAVYGGTGEIILPRGATGKVVSRSVSPKGRTIITVQH